MRGGNIGKKKKWRVVWSRGRFGLVCRETKPRIRLVLPCGYLFEVFSPTDPLAANTSFPCRNCYLHHHPPHSASSSASFSNGYSSNSLCHCLSSVEDTTLLQPICTRHKFIFIKIKSNASQKVFLLYKIPNLLHSDKNPNFKLSRAKYIWYLLPKRAWRWIIIFSS